MIKRRNRKFLVGISVVFVLLIASTITIWASSLLSSDEFDENQKTEITEHDPDVDASGDGWSVELGEWEVHQGSVKEKSDPAVEVSSDYRALLDAGDSDVSAKVVLKIETGDQIWGPVVRHSGPRDWIMAFHDNFGEIVLGKKRPDEDLIGDTVSIAHPSAGGFQELGRVAAAWSNGQTHSIELEVDGSAIKVYVDDVLVLTAIDDDGMTSTFVGVFSRGDGKNKLESFNVTTVD